MVLYVMSLFSDQLHTYNRRFFGILYVYQPSLQVVKFAKVKFIKDIFREIEGLMKSDLIFKYSLIHSLLLTNLSSCCYVCAL